jgi:hypothetical protein
MDLYKPINVCVLILIQKSPYRLNKHTHYTISKFTVCLFLVFVRPACHVLSVTSVLCSRFVVSRFGSVLRLSVLVFFGPCGAVVRAVCPVLLFTTFSLGLSRFIFRIGSCCVSVCFCRVICLVTLRGDDGGVDGGDDDEDDDACVPGGCFPVEGPAVQSRMLVDTAPPVPICKLEEGLHL